MLLYDEKICEHGGWAHDPVVLRTAIKISYYFINNCFWVISNNY